MAENVTVQFLKYDGTIHWRHEVVELGTDSHGRWLGGPRGSTTQRGDEPEIAWETAVVLLIPTGKWWTAFFDEGGKYQIYIDITAGAEWVAPDRVEMVDLDLDVVRYPDGLVALLDEDEFVDHSAAMGYPPSIIDGARSTAAELVIALEGGRAPFDVETYGPWLQMVS
ncbi:MAG: DUF402 domain-containing protein [Acidimicrobiia bacterium]|nr:DUF402 domain-containing protein [Acidimicrobiia bacterium]